MRLVLGLFIALGLLSTSFACAPASMKPEREIIVFVERSSEVAFHDAVRGFASGRGLSYQINPVAPAERGEFLFQMRGPHFHIVGDNIEQVSTISMYFYLHRDADAEGRRKMENAAIELIRAIKAVPGVRIINNRSR